MILPYWQNALKHINIISCLYLSSIFRWYAKTIEISKTVDKLLVPIAEQKQSGAAAPLCLKLNVSYHGCFCVVRINWGSSFISGMLYYNSVYSTVLITFTHLRCNMIFVSIPTATIKTTPPVATRIILQCSVINIYTAITTLNAAQNAIKIMLLKNQCSADPAVPPLIIPER